MTENEIVGKSFTIQKGPFKDLGCIVTDVGFTTKVLIDVEINHLDKTIYTALSEESLGVTIDHVTGAFPGEIH